METPARHSFTLDGTTQVFPIPSNLKGDNYVRVEVDGTVINDKAKYDIVNNSIVMNFVEDVPDGSQLDVLVVQSEEAIGQLGTTSSIDIVAVNISTINDVNDALEDIITAADNIVDIQNAEENAASALASKNAAATSATNANNSATAAATSASNAASSASAASTSATSASTSANTATNEANDAEASAVSALTNAITAITKASEASTSASNAATSETNASGSATAAATSATNASNSASSASTSATTATTQASIATTQASNAASSASSASTSAINASTSADNASTSATEASTSASNASTNASNASTSASNAATSATTAQNAATTATTQATLATTAASNASTSETNAATSATNAASSASSASTSASTATTQATNAATSASNASTSASAAAGSATSASAAADAALSALDSFDDRYLGTKSSDPTLDNDGNALVSGALYFNTVDSVMKVYEGTTWVAAYASLSGALIANNNLSDLNNVSSARENLGLGTAATTNSTAYATAAQGALADSALQSYTETDPVYTSSSWYTTTNNFSNWNTAYSWGNHASAGYLTSLTGALLTGDIGVTVQAYDADTTKNDVANTFTANQVISVTDNTNSALRVTQTGTGNALLVEDATNPDSTPFVINASGNVGIGTDSPSLPLNIGDSTLPAGVNLLGQQISSGLTGTRPLLSLKLSASSGNPVLAQFTSSGTPESPTAVANNRGLGRNNWYGFDGTDYLNGAFIAAATDATPTTGSMPARLTFGTTASGNSTPTERVRITSDGKVGIGTSNPSTELDVSGTVTADAFVGEGSGLTGLPAGYTDADALSLFNVSGSAPVYACRAWVNFNGTGTVAIRASGNVSSITDNGFGDYTVNFTTAMVDADYVWAGGATWSTTYGGLIFVDNTYSPTTTTLRFYVQNTSYANNDATRVCIAIFR